MKPLVYVSSPYSIVGKIDGTIEEDKAVLERRVKQVNKFIAACMRVYFDKYLFFGPVSHSHPVGQFMPSDFNTFWFWVESQDHYWVAERADEVWVLMLDGWKESKGVQYEIALAKERGIPIKYFDPKTYEQEG